MRGFTLHRPTLAGRPAGACRRDSVNSGGGDYRAFRARTHGAPSGVVYQRPRSVGDSSKRWQMLPCRADAKLQPAVWRATGVLAAAAGVLWCSRET